MENSYMRKNQLRTLLERRGMVLDENYIGRGRELLSAAQTARAKANMSPVFPVEEEEADMAKAARLKPKPYTLTRIIAYSLYIFGLLSLLLPIDPFISRIPICGIFIGLGGIVYFSYLLGGKKRKQKADAYRVILKKYGVEDYEDIAEVQKKRRALASAADEAETQVLKFIRFADGNVASIDECSGMLDRLEVIIREYRSL